MAIESEMRIVWEDSSCLVVNKPSGLLTTAARGVDSLEIQLREFLSRRENQDAPFVGLPHRIDRPVSGGLLVGKTAKATRLFCQQFQARSIEKTYLAVIEGQVDDEESTWIDWMRKLPEEAHAEIVPPSHEHAKKAILRYRRLGENEGLSLIEIQLETGRTHQIRLQCSCRGYPVVGDMQYGGKRGFGSQFEDPRKRAIALHAWQLAFRHPKSGRRIEVQVPLPEAWKEFPFPQSLTHALGDGS